MLHIDVHGRGPRLVLVHGFTQTGRSWAPVVPALARSHQVVCADLPGHGHSGAYAADLWESARLLGEVAGPATYVGYSLGGRVCLHLALAAPYLVRGLVLVSATAGIDDPASRAERRAADEALAAGIEAGGVPAFIDRWLAQPLFATLPAGAAGLPARLENAAAGLASSLRLAGAGSQEPLWDRLATLAMPVVVVAGELDGAYLAVAGRMVAAIGANATLEVVAGAGHAVPGERPGELVAIVGRCMRDVGAT